MTTGAIWKSGFSSRPLVPHSAGTVTIAICSRRSCGSDATTAQAIPCDGVLSPSRCSSWGSSAPRAHLLGVFARIPVLFRAFIRFCHHERGTPPYLTEETLDTVDRWEPDFQSRIRTKDSFGPAALL